MGPRACYGRWGTSPQASHWELVPHLLGFKDHSIYFHCSMFFNQTYLRPNLQNYMKKQRKLIAQHSQVLL